MALHEVPPLQWIGVLDRFGREHHGWLATVKQQSPGRPEATVALERPLQSVEAGLSGLSVDSVVIRFADDAAVRVERPTTLRVAQTEEGLDCGLDIATAHDVTHLRLRTAARPEQLDGIAPAERR